MCDVRKARVDCIYYYRSSLASLKSNHAKISPGGGGIVCAPYFQLRSYFRPRGLKTEKKRGLTICPIPGGSPGPHQGRAEGVPHRANGHLFLSAS